MKATGAAVAIFGKGAFVAIIIKEGSIWIARIKGTGIFKEEVQ
jgi:hypothetical protein